MKKTVPKLSLLLLTVAVIASLTACSGIRTSLKKPIPEAEYTSFGYAINTVISGDKLTVTYALVGFKEDKILNLYLDKIEKNVGDEKSTSTNKEMGSAYGLGYISDKGEFKTQLEAFENYVMGHKMTLEEINEIETYKKDEENPSLPKEGTDLAVACGLNIGEYIELINRATENRIEKECMKIGLGEQIVIRNVKNEITIPFAVIASDYNSKIVYSFLDMYTVNKGDTEVKSQKQKAENNAEIQNWVDSLEGYEGYMLGRNIGDSVGVETYGTADGSALRLPRPDTDLAAVCSIDINYFINVLNEASNRSK